MTPVLRAASNILVHVPDLVRYGSKCFREIADQGGAFSGKLSEKIRSLEDAVAYPPNQVFIGNLPPEDLAEVESAPGSLDEALAELKKDPEFLLKGDVFTQDVLDMWIEYKIKNEINEVKLRPHPHEFYLYYDI